MVLEILNKKNNTMKKINLDFNGHFDKGTTIAIASVKCDNEQKAESFLDSYLEENYPNYGREDSHFSEDGMFYFRIVE